MAAGTLIVRADAAVDIGTGHVMRCLALAQAWQDSGGEVVFAMARSTPAIAARLAGERFEVLNLTPATGDAPQLIAFAKARHARWIVLDGYHFQPQYQHSIRDAGFKLMLLDDGWRPDHYFADLVLNQNVHAEEFLYSKREPYTRLLLGPAYAMLRREFTAWHNSERVFPAVAAKVLITMGGSDPDNLTLRAIRALQSLSIAALETTVVVGGSNPHLESLQRAASPFGTAIRLIKDPANMPELMSAADVAISGAGATCWEMCFLGLPALVVDLAPNQLPIARELSRSQVAIHLGSTATVTESHIATQLEALLRSAARRAAMSAQGRALIDGKGAQRVLCALQTSTLRLRPVEQRDCRLLWEWANEPGVRAASFSQHPIPWEDHQAWFAGKMKDRNSLILIGEDERGAAIGQFRADTSSGKEKEAYIDVSLAPEARGAGCGSLLIDSGVRQVFASTTAQSLHAFIRPENRASLRAFERAGFTRLGQELVKGNPAIHYIRMRETAGAGR